MIRYLKDCVDNYDPKVFQFDLCESSDRFKCDNGRCFYKTNLDVDCNKNFSLL